MALPFAETMSRHWDGCPLGLGLVHVAEDIPTVFMHTYMQYVLPALRSIPIHVEISDLSLPSSAKELLDPFEVEVVEHALVTFTTGSTGMPKLMLRQHRLVGW